jgi:small subunit ribosomal protein S6
LRTYEALYIINPTLEDDAIQTIVNEVEALVTNQGGAIVRSEIWGRRKLAYIVKKHTDGCFVLLRFTANPEFVQKIETYFKLNESILRFMVVHFDEQTLKLEAEQQRRNLEEMRNAANRSRDDDDEDDDPVPAGRRQRDDDED